MEINEEVIEVLADEVGGIFEFGKLGVAFKDYDVFGHRELVKEKMEEEGYIYDDETNVDELDVETNVISTIPYEQWATVLIEEHNYDSTVEMAESIGDLQQRLSDLSGDILAVIFSEEDYYKVEITIKDEKIDWNSQFDLGYYASDEIFFEYLADSYNDDRYIAKLLELREDRIVELINEQIADITQSNDYEYRSLSEVDSNNINYTIKTDDVFETEEFERQLFSKYDLNDEEEYRAYFTSDEFYTDAVETKLLDFRVDVDMEKYEFEEE